MRKWLYLMAYRMGLGLYRTGIGLAALLGHAKARMWVQGRRGWRHKLEALQLKEPAIWLHASSLGEFEQGRPVLEALRALYPAVPVVVTFFSPSGYMQRKDYPCAGVFYLPLDAPGTARQFLQYIPVRLAIFVKYDFWYYYLAALRAQGTPTVLLAACITPDNAVLRPALRPLYKPMIHAYNHIFCQDSQTAHLLQSQLGYAATTVCGDPRFDRVQAVAQSATPLAQVDDFLGGRWALVAGSTYAVCDHLLAQALQLQWPADMVLVVAPHDVGASRVQQVLDRWPGIAMRWSQWIAAPPADPQQYRVLVIDNVGMLARLYRYGRLNYVGGALGKGGIHNILESAVYGVPTLYGPHHHKFPEAAALVAVGGGIEVETPQQVAAVVQAASVQDAGHQAAGAHAAAFVKNGGGATQAVVAWVHAQGLL